MKELDTKFKVGEKVFERSGDNIFEWKIITIEVEATISKEKEENDYEEEYYVERKEREGLLKTKTINWTFSLDREDIFKTKKEALEFLEKCQEAEALLRKEGRCMPVEEQNIRTATEARFWGAFKFNTVDTGRNLY